MSHVATIDLDIKDLAALKKAASQLGLEFKEDQKHYKWYGESYGDYPLPEGFTKKDLGKCEHALSIPNSPASYEIGITKRRDGRPGYTLLWDFWQGGYGLQAHVGENADRLRQLYSAEVAKKEARKKGFRLVEKKLGNGNIIITGVKI